MTDSDQSHKATCFSCPIIVDRLVKAASVSSIRAGIAQKSIKTYFLKGKAHESGNCREDQIEKNATVPKHIVRKTHRRPNNLNQAINEQHNKNSSQLVSVCTRVVIELGVYPQKLACTPNLKSKGYMYPQFQNGVGMLVFCPTTINLIDFHRLFTNY